MDSILESVKKQIGILDDYDHFNPEIIMAINAAFFVLNQLGVGPAIPFTISGEEETWDDFEYDGDIDVLKVYLALKVKLTFDPPTSSYLIENINKEIAMYEFRMLVDAERGDLPEPDLTGVYREESS